MKMMSKFFHVLLLSLAVCALPAQETASSQGDRGLLGSLFRPLGKLSETVYSLKTILTDPIGAAQPQIPGAAALGKTADEVAAKATAIAVPSDTTATKEAAVKTVAPADEATAKAATTADAASANAAVPADTAKKAVTADAAKEAVTADAKAAAPATAPTA